MDIHVNPDEIEATQHILSPIEKCMGLCNDYFSYKKEKEDLRQGNGLNAVWFLRQKEGLSEKEALDQVKSKIISLEEAHNVELARSINDDLLSVEMGRYITFFRLAHGGLHVFHTVASRYESTKGQKPCPHQMMIRLTMVFCFVYLLINLLSTP